MKNITLILTGMIVCCLGCNREPTATQQLEKIKTETKEASQQLKNYTFKERREFVAQMQVELDMINKNMDSLSVKMEHSSEAVRNEARPRYQQLKEQVAQLDQQLDRIRNA